MIGICTSIKGELVNTFCKNNLNMMLWHGMGLLGLLPRVWGWYQGFGLLPVENNILVLFSTGAGTGIFYRPR